MNNSNLTKGMNVKMECAGGLYCSPVKFANNYRLLPYDNTGQQMTTYQMNNLELQQMHQQLQGQEQQRQQRYQMQQGLQLQGQQQQQVQQQQGAGSDWSNSFHAYGTLSGPLSRYSTAHIAQSALFNPFQAKRSFATPTTGIVPTGQFYML